jgi:hypothetical protein
MISEREKYLMSQAWCAAQYYEDLDAWLNEPISDDGNIVEQHLDYDATRLHGNANYLIE